MEDSHQADQRPYWGGLLHCGQPRPGGAGRPPAPPHPQLRTGGRTLKETLAPLRGEEGRTSTPTQKQVASHPPGQRRPSSSDGRPRPRSPLGVKASSVSPRASQSCLSDFSLVTFVFCFHEYVYFSQKQTFYIKDKKHTLIKHRSHSEHHRSNASSSVLFVDKVLKYIFEHKLIEVVM